MSKWFLFLATLVPAMAFCTETVIRCRGTAPAENLYFNYDMSTPDYQSYQIRLTYSREYNQLEDTGWKNFTSYHDKITVPTPWKNAWGILKRQGERWDLILIDINTGEELPAPLYDNFMCVPREH